VLKDLSNVQRTIEFDLTGHQPKPIQLTQEGDEETQDEEDEDKKMAERVRKLRYSHEKFKENDSMDDEVKKSSIDDLENEPAYVRKKVRLDDVTHSKETNVSKYSLSEDEDKNAKLRDDNAYLHDNVD